MRSQHMKMVLFLGALATIASAGSAQNKNAQPAQQAKQAPPPTTAELLSASEAIVANSVALSQAVRALVDQATEDNDMIKVTCLKDKQTQIDGHLQTAQTHLSALRKATTADAKAHEYTMIVVTGQKLDVLNKEAGQCVGKDLYETGTTTVDTVIDTDMLPFENNPSIVPTILPPSLPTLPPAISEIR